MTLRIGINGFGRIERLVLRTGRPNPDLDFVRINDPGGGAATFTHLLQFDPVYGQWSGGSDDITSTEGAIVVADAQVKLYAWHDNEDGDACRVSELAAKAGKVDA